MYENFITNEFIAVFFLGYSFGFILIICLINLYYWFKERKEIK